MCVQNKVVGKDYCKHPQATEDILYQLGLQRTQLCEVYLCVCVQSKVVGEDYGKHLQGTQDLLEQHSLQEAQLQALTRRVRKLNRKSQGPKEQSPRGNTSLDKRLEGLNEELNK